MANKPMPCEHLRVDNFETFLPADSQCAECAKTGDRWVHLRKCTHCGVVLCCDSSPNQHARKHFHASGHPVIISAEPEERWAWCYPDEQFIRY